MYLHLFLSISSSLFLSFYVPFCIICLSLFSTCCTQSYTNPATPGSTSYENPNTPSPFVADSPQSSSSHYGSQYGSRTPMFSGGDYKYTPSPGNTREWLKELWLSIMQITVMILLCPGYSPMTPGSNLEYSPRTPGSPLDTGLPTLPTDIEVVVKDIYHVSDII